jgi:E3 ubiquitin-protein ligase MARCH6
MQQGFLMATLVVKVIFFIIVELIVFPTTCGALLDLVTLPLFPNTTLFTRIEFQLDAPFTSVFLHWFVGTGFMYFFSSFIILCRKIVRPGVMWFIRDPNDPRFHPMKEILERTAWVQLRRVAASGFMYIAIILLCFGGTIYGIQRYTTGILPLRWSIK